MDQFHCFQEQNQNDFSENNISWYCDISQAKMECIFMKTKPISNLCSCNPFPSRKRSLQTNTDDRRAIEKNILSDQCLCLFSASTE